MITLSFLVDDTLELALEPELYPLAERWIPHGLEKTGPAGARAAINVRASRVALQRSSRRPTLTLGHAAAWVLTPGVVVLRGGLASSGGELNLVSGEGRLCVDPTRFAPPGGGPATAAETGRPPAGAALPPGGAAADLYSMLTISAGLLLAGQERALVHAAGVVDAAGGAWLLAGDARAGKSTTCVTLIEAGWDYLSDDQVVLALREDEVQAQGWLRPFHLDDGLPVERREISPAAVGLASWRRTAPLAGVIFPVVAPNQPTELRRISPADALAGLVRQSPWLLASPRTASSTLRLFEHAVTGGAFRLRLGLDTYRAPDRLAACLAALETRMKSAC